MLQRYNKAFSLEQANTSLIGTNAHPRHLHSAVSRRPVLQVCQLITF